MFAKLFSRPEPAPEEAAYRRLVRKGYQPRSIVDVGAYEGNWTRLAKSCFPAASVLMCEAQPGKLPLLQKVCGEFPDVRLESAVIAARSGETVDFSEMETGSSIFPENSNVARTVRKLQTRTLDEVTAGLEGPSFLKIDVQGAELEVLKGGARFLDQCDLVQLEVALQDYNRGAPGFLEVIGFMNERQFVPYDFSGWSRPNGVDLVQVDIMFVPAGSPLRTRYFEF